MRKLLVLMLQPPLLLNRLFNIADGGVRSESTTVRVTIPLGHNHSDFLAGFVLVFLILRARALLFATSPAFEILRGGEGFRVNCSS